MEVTVSYSKIQLDAAVEFIAKHNQSFLGQHDLIREQMIHSMHQMALTPGEWITGTMGYVLWGDRSDEGIDSDENAIRYDIYVDPALSQSSWDLDDIVEEVVSGDSNDKDLYEH